MLCDKRLVNLGAHKIEVPVVTATQRSASEGKNIYAITVIDIRIGARKCS